MQDQELCQDRTLQVLDRALHDFEATALWALGTNNNHDGLDQYGWKKLRSQTGVTLYADHSANDPAWVSAMRGEEWGHPLAVMAVGRMNCSLDDLLFGMTASTPAELKQRAALVDAEDVSHVDFAAIATPTEEAPFRFLGVTRYVTAVSTFRRPREYLLACGRGEVTTTSGERLGYEVNQSVTLEQWPVKDSIPRGHVIQARVLRELPDGSIGVYYKIIADAKTILPDSVVYSAMWKAVQRFWELAPRGADTKKLCCCVDNKRALRLSNLQAASRCTDPLRCRVCKTSLPDRRRKNVGSISTALTHGSSTQTYWCVLCTSWLCSKASCCEIRQLVRVDPSSLEVHQQNVTLCAKCARLVRRKSASEIARCVLQQQARALQRPPVSQRDNLHV
ncbi:unnamed protein product [Phytophthora fragariaefolia]|uniref:Unnamed protein product n=1 Tax=Phytophthora fragariaefolia TaxID=1490495 RepID=A0A9W6X765_9STRA|nr:unnamed protein product [Phytophthora fragariaefolia]